MIDAPSSTWFTASPDWHWLIVLYFFFGGLAGGCYVLAAVIDLMGRDRDRPLARAGYFAVLPCLALSALALIFDLSRPGRFWHIVVESNTGWPLLQAWTPMNSAAWMLLAFSLIALLSALAAAAEAGWLRWPAALRLRPPGTAGVILSILGALLGLYIASYEGALLAFTSRPVWADTPLIGMVLVLSALSMAAAFLVLLGRWRAWDLPGMGALRRIDAQALVVAFLALVALIVSLGGAAQALLSPLNLALLAAVLVVGFVAPLGLRLGGNRLGGHAVAAAAGLAIAGGFLLRAFIVFSPYGAGS
jgi:formate-dependent nitrite reductase membrane component NrfD